MQNKKLICLDIESTGLNTKLDRIIEVAAVRFSLKKNLDSFETLVNPKCKIPMASQKIHRITDDMVKDKPEFRTILPQLKEFIDGAIIVGHGINWDIECLENATQEHHFVLFEKKPVIIDTLRLARLCGHQPTSFSLEHLRDYFNIPSIGFAHRAMNDVLVNIELFRVLAKDYKSLSHLIKRLAKPILLKVMPLGKHKGRRFDEIPLDYLYWALRKKFDQDLLYSIRCHIKLRQNGRSFTQATNPFSNL